MDRLTSMAVFVKTVDLGSFAAAADALNMSGPMVGKHVRFLEQRLGARLLNRTTRRQSLTDIGHAYYERCRTVLAEADAADALAAAGIAYALAAARPAEFDLPAADLHAAQIGWKAEQAESLESYLRSRGRDATISRSWPFED